MQLHTVMVLQFDSHRSRYIRGTITDGTDWIFLYLELNAEQTGGKYYQSIAMSVNEADIAVNKDKVDKLVAVLADWVRFSGAVPVVHIFTFVLDCPLLGESGR